MGLVLTRCRPGGHSALCRKALQPLCPRAGCREASRAQGARPVPPALPRAHCLRFSLFPISARLTSSATWMFSFVVRVWPHAPARPCTTVCVGAGGAAGRGEWRVKSPVVRGPADSSQGQPLCAPKPRRGALGDARRLRPEQRPSLVGPLYDSVTRNEPWTPSLRPPLVPTSGPHEPCQSHPVLPAWAQPGVSPDRPLCPPSLELECGALCLCGSPGPGCGRSGNGN